MLNLAYLIVLIKMKPYRNLKVNKIRISSEGLYTFSSFLLILLPIIEVNEYFDIYKTLGWVIIWIFLVVFILEMVSLLLIKKKKLLKSTK